MSEQSSRGPEWERVRKAVLDRDGWLCVYCGKQLEGSDATVDHILARDNGGLDEMSNLVAACRADNGRKGARMLFRINYVNPRWLDSVV